MGIASLILGIVSIALGWLGSWLWILIGAAGIVLGAIGKKKNQKCAKGGLVCSIIGTSLSVVFYIACIACAASLGLL